MINLDFLLQLTAGGCDRSGPSDLKSAAEIILLIETKFEIWTVWSQIKGQDRLQSETTWKRYNSEPGFLVWYVFQTHSMNLKEMIRIPDCDLHDVALPSVYAQLPVIYKSIMTTNKK